MLRHLGLPTLALGLILSLASVAPATAETWTAADVAGDVDGSSYDPEPEPCGTTTELDATHRTDLDIVGLKARHGLRDLVVTVRLADLIEGEESWLRVPILTPRSDYDVDIWFRRNGRQVVDWNPRFQSKLAAAADAAEEQAGDEECYGFIFGYSPGHCDGLVAARSFERDRVVITVPRSCLDAPRAVRVAAETSAWEDATDGYYRDERSDDGKQRLRPNYGAWVRSSAG